MSTGLLEDKQTENREFYLAIIRSKNSGLHDYRGAYDNYIGLCKRKIKENDLEVIAEATITSEREIALLFGSDNREKRVCESHILYLLKRLNDKSVDNPQQALDELRKHVQTEHADYQP